VPPAQRRPEIPQAIDTICLKCLDKDPARRYDTALALAEDLARAARGEPIHAERESRKFYRPTWSRELLNHAWADLAEEERRTGWPLYTVLHFRADHPEMRSAQIAEQVRERLGETVSADEIRQWLHDAREKFGELLLSRVASSLPGASVTALEQELIDLELLGYTQMAIHRRRQRAEENR
jgi:hypothetical protein